METIMLETAADQYIFDASSGRLVSLRAKAAPEVELITTSADQPAFVLQYLNEAREYAQVDSSSARLAQVGLEDDAGGQKVTLRFSGVGGMDLDVTIEVRASLEDRWSRWGCTVRNAAGVQIVDVQFPLVVLAMHGEDAVLQPAGFGELWSGEMLKDLTAEEPRQWQLIPENGNSPHYPGRFFAQFLAGYGGKGGEEAASEATGAKALGVYLACEDTEANVKLFRALRRGDGIRLGVAHVGDWPGPADAEPVRTLEYETVLGSFAGDWYDAAEIYRQWALRQKWATPLTERTDIPQWLLDSPPHITIRLQGYLDDGPAPVIEEFVPYEKCIPLLEGVAQRVQAPLTAVLMSWERGGPWVYPDCFPPVGGDESLTNFCQMARERGWHVGSFCNGTRWVIRHLFNDYEGREFFEQHHAEQGICRTPSGELWAEFWDQNWRPSYTTCMAQAQTKQLAQDFVKRLIGWGMQSIQFFDQNCNAATFPCFAADHGHLPVPGKWMARAMEEMIASFRDAARQAGEDAVIQSTENPCNEYCLPLFQQSDLRVSPPSSGLSNFVPVYHYLYHECTILHGMMSTGGEPYALPIRNAWNGVLGEIPGAVLTGDGTLLNRETFNWADWEPKVGSNDDALEMIRTVTALRRGPGREFLVYGRMLRPAEVEGIEIIEWEHGGRHYAVPAVAHAAWQAPDGRRGVALANWTTKQQTVTVHDARLGENVTVHTFGRGSAEETTGTSESGVRITLEPLGCGLVEG